MFLTNSIFFFPSEFDISMAKLALSKFKPTTLAHLMSQPLGVAGHVPGDVVDAVVWREKLIQVDHSWVELFTQNLLMFPFFSFL